MFEKARDQVYCTPRKEGTRRMPSEDLKLDTSLLKSSTSWGSTEESTCQSPQKSQLFDLKI